VADTTQAAILVVHGIGEQKPYEALDGFARGLARELGVRAGQLEHRLVWRDGRATSCVRVPAPPGRLDVDALDLYELYWAGMVEGRIRLREVLTWIARTSLTPLRLWAQNRELLAGERGAARRRLWILLREFGRAALLLAAAAFIIGAVLAAARQRDDVTTAVTDIWGLVRDHGHPWALVVWAASVLFAVMVAVGWRRSRPRGAGVTDTERAASAWWRRASLVAVVVLLGLATAVDVLSGLRVWGLVGRIVYALTAPRVLGLLGAAALALALRHVLVKYLGDVVLYVTADERSSLYRTRAEILDLTTRRLRGLLEDDGYAAVYVAGHSLGSVIAYDAVNRLANEVRADGAGAPPGKTTRERFDKLAGLLTFGSPLDKVYYFFRTEVGPAQAIRAQLLSSLHAFKKAASGRDYGDLRLARYATPQPPSFRWLNVYSPTDPVSGYLDFYRLEPPGDAQVSLWYGLRFAHTAYWSDPRFYHAVVTRWLARRP